jgi:hypothetical protein
LNINTGHDISRLVKSSSYYSVQLLNKDTGGAECSCEDYTSSASEDIFCLERSEFVTVYRRVQHSNLVLCQTNAVNTPQSSTDGTSNRAPDRRKICQLA